MLGFAAMRPTLRSTALALAAASVLGVLEIIRTTLTRVIEGYPTAPRWCSASPS